MSELPLYSVEMRKLRGDVSIVKFAAACGISRETVRLVEKGGLRPSKDLLAKWLRQAGTSPEERPDIARSILGAKLQRKSSQEVVDLQALTSTSAKVEDCLNQIMSIIGDGGYLPEDALLYKRHQIEQVLRRHGG